jgi:hypothetical protein
MDMLEGDGFHAVRLDNTTGWMEATGCTGPRGYREIGDYNSNPSGNRWFEKTLARLVRGFT